MLKNESGHDESMSTFQSEIETAARGVSHSTKSDMEKAHMLHAPEIVKIREEAAASCSKVIGRKVQRKQARRARVSHCVKCSLEPGTKNQKKALDRTIC